METKDRFLRITVIIALVLVAGLSLVVHAYA
jgi:Flp pilus assembly pilin Flp